jgi:hypothetical protein
MDQILEILRLIEALPEAWSALTSTTREVVYGLLPPELDSWLASNEWLLWGAVVIVAVLLIVTAAGSLGGSG